MPYSSRILARVGGFSYDAAGNVLNDNANAYLYDGEGRLCAVKDLTTGGMFEYIYDADGERVIKGTIATFNCNPAGNGFTPTSVYVRGLNGKELTETNGSFQWDHTNVFAGGELLATYKGTDTYFALNDWLGTKRGEATPDGCRATYISLPYGNDLTASGCIPDATEQHFTGKEHDTESGNDYFGARYYNSSTGRFLSPDWSAIPAAVPYADLTNPQSLNLYSYVRNNPLSRVDPDGHCGSSNSTADWMCHNGFRKLAEAAYGAFGYGAPPRLNQTQQQDPAAPPLAMLQTIIKGGTTTFEWTDKSGGYHEDKVHSLVKVDHRSKPGAGGPFKSHVVGQVNGLRSRAYGPEGAQINTGDSRGRWIHGGGTSLGVHAYDPHQRLTPTFGCTRACNTDVQRIGREITNFQIANPGTPIPYWRTEQ